MNLLLSRIKINQIVKKLLKWKGFRDKRPMKSLFIKIMLLRCDTEWLGLLAAKFRNNLLPKDLE